MSDSVRGFKTPVRLPTLAVAPFRSLVSWFSRAREYQIACGVRKLARRPDPACLQRDRIYAPHNLRCEGITVIHTPIAAPKAKTHAERWVGSVRRECLDKILIISQRHLERVLREYVDHHNTHRPHRALQQQPPIPKPILIRTHSGDVHVRRRDRLGGLLHEYELAA